MKSDRASPTFSTAYHVMPTLQDTHVAVRIRPGGDPTLQYELPIPRGWHRATAYRGPARPAGNPDTIGLFCAAPDAQGPRVVVSVTQLRWEVDPIEWVRYGWACAGWRVAVARAVDHPRGPRFEVGALKDVGSRIDVRRTTGFVDNGRLFRVDVVASLLEWSRVHDELWACGALADLCSPTGRTQVETRHRCEGPGLAFAIPTSWGVDAPMRRGNGVRWQGALESSVQRGARISIVSQPGPDDEATLAPRRAAIQRRLRAAQIAVSRSMEPVEEDALAELDGWRGMYRCTATFEDARYELRIAQRHLGGLDLDYVMLAPAPLTHHLDWMRATQAHRITILDTETPT
jgi:hypothetical protein